ncbi:hypothetical protein [Paraburkholderia youngii]|uniref:hypothetical protein n=1 Tax=Paraburkholderia youngii TaxID=2782701 RepID=UPI001591FC9C|nr:hypothetical protein [Paraburkholderia youngii]NUX58674.1 hypothetical protein [Paraburkholderia youngii]
MAQTVEITQADDGSYTVGLVDEPSADQEDTQQVQSIDQALAMAKHLLSNPPADDGDNDADDQGQAGAADDTNQPATAGSSPAAAASGAKGGNDAQAMWDQLAAQQGPAH